MDANETDVVTDIQDSPGSHRICRSQQTVSPNAFLDEKYGASLLTLQIRYRDMELQVTEESKGTSTAAEPSGTPR